MKPARLLIMMLALFASLSLACGLGNPQGTTVQPRGNAQEGGGIGDADSGRTRRQSQNEPAATIPPAATIDLGNRQDRGQNGQQGGNTQQDEVQGGEAQDQGDVPEAGGVAAQGGDSNEPLVQLYEVAGPGVVSIRIQTTQGGGQGSGFIYDPQGHIVTNDHVVMGAQAVVVTFFNGLEARADVIGTDNDSDLAVIRVDRLPEDTVYLPLADSDLVRPGQQAIAIGNPFGNQGTMTAGIVSAVGRSIPSLEQGFNIPLAIQTDAPINPGNSGGPLLNSAGQVIGVNSQITSGTGANAGIGFAVPSNIVQQVIPVLIREGRYQWPWLGVSGDSVSLALAEVADLPVERGAYIDSVVPGGPADQAGLRGAEYQVRDGLEIPIGGDIIVEADGEPINSWDDLLGRVAFRQAGDTMNLIIIRDGQEFSVDVQLGARPDNFQQGGEFGP